jgi:bifunctional non-homologous end joining protein LigD
MTNTLKNVLPLTADLTTAELAEALAGLRFQNGNSCLVSLDKDVRDYLLRAIETRIVCDEDGLAVFDLIRRYGTVINAEHCAFDLFELDGRDLRRTPIEQRKRKLAKLVRGPHPGIVLNKVFEGDGDVLFEHAFKLGCEGIVSKRLGSLYRSGRSPHWVKVKNPNAPAVKREARRIGTLNTMSDWWKGEKVLALLIAAIAGCLDGSFRGDGQTRVLS